MANEFIPIRLSHLLRYSGVGAIVRGPNGTVVVQDTRQWTDRQGNPAGKLIPYVERVRAALDIEQELREPPVAKELANSQVGGTCVPATRFPSWMRCPSCGALFRSPWQHDQSDDAPRCNRAGCGSHPKLEQVTWVLAHSEGYLADVPWHYLVHLDARAPEQSNCKVEDQLQLIDSVYEKRDLKCVACGAATQFHGDEYLGFGQGWMQPWTNDDSGPPREDIDGNQGNPAQVLSINDTRVYAPDTESVLVIPPESRVRKGTVVDQLYRKSDDRSRIDGVRTPLARQAIIQALTTQYRCTRDDIETALADLEHGYPLYGENLTPGQLQEDEFKALLEILSDQSEDEDLVTRNRSDEWRELGRADDLDTDAQKIIKCTRDLVGVDRLKAVQVFKGFTRLDGEEVPPDIVGKSDWLPAIELYGEGIFLTLDEERLQVWEQSRDIGARLNQLIPRFNQFGRDDPNPLTPRFMLLHTLSHLLMRQIEAEGGYPAASLIERIYCGNAPEPMAGILIHVAVPDIAGSLGGLAELAEPRRFLGILTRALEHSRWCSLDPVCSEHEGQGPGLLNRAACHACALVPEPACNYGNTLLDRGFVKGDAASGLPAYFEMP
jgi:hypothetical protein